MLEESLLPLTQSLLPLTQSLLPLIQSLLPLIQSLLPPIQSPIQSPRLQENQPHRETIYTHGSPTMYATNLGETLTENSNRRLPLTHVAQ